MGRTQKSEAIVLRSIRFSEADRILHLYTAHRGRIGAIAKGVRKTKSRFGGRLEPLSHVELMLHEGSGELQTITGVELLRSHHETREDGYRLIVGLIGAEASPRRTSAPSQRWPVSSTCSIPRRRFPAPGPRSTRSCSRSS